ncbi:hypothetical protein M9Y10_028885 [Tritrichomonas musculus]|uniref:Uncharacterized protein n=1 Tax=Tritrichomonas musculus TaxID=1915356 RepID=A0ABR2KNW6_9EUKA
MSNLQNKEEFTFFKSISDGLFTSFSPVANQIFCDFRSQISSDKYSNEQLDLILEKTLTTFPRSQPSYSQIINTLTSFVQLQPGFILSKLCSEFKKEISADNVSIDPFISFDYFSYFEMSNVYHSLFHQYFNLIVLSDLIYSIYRKNPDLQIDKMVSYGFKLCSERLQIPKLQDLIIEKWALIFYHLSNTMLDEMNNSFREYIHDENSNLIFHLISRSQCNQSLIDTILSLLHQAKKRKALNSEILSYLSILLERAECDENTLNEFFKIAWENKSQHGIKHGAIDLITTLFNRIPAQAKKAPQFYQMRVYKHASEDSKIERSLRAFLRLIRGDISHVEDSNEGVDPLSFIDCKSSNSGESYLSIFMRIFFAKSNFSVCYELFRDVLIHLISIDISEFIKNAFPKFLSLEPTDPRFLTLFMTVPFINRHRFYEKSYCHADGAQIDKYNELIRDAILKKCKLLIKKKAEKEKKQHCLFIQDSYQLQSVLKKADIFMDEFVSINKYNFVKYDTEPNQKIKLANPNSIMVYILKSIPYCFNVENYRNEKFIQKILKLTVDPNQFVSFEAVNVYKTALHTITENDSNADFIVKIILQMINESFIPELLAKLLRLLSETIIDKTITISENVKRNVKITALFVIGSDIPILRTLAMKVMSEVDVSTIFSMFNKFGKKIYQNVKRSILALNIPPKPSIIKPLHGQLSYGYTCCSNYFEIWIIFYAEIINQLIPYKEIMSSLLHITMKTVNNMPNLFKTNSITEHQAISVFYVYLNALSSTVDIGVDNQSIESINTNNDASNINHNNFDFDFESNEEEEEEQRQELGIKKERRIEEEEEEEYFELPIIEEAERLCKEIVQSDVLQMKRAFIYSIRYLNWRIVGSILPYIIYVDQELYTELSTALTLIIPNDENFSHLAIPMFNIVLKFLSLLKDYFTLLNINNTRNVQIDLNKLEEKHEVCLNYCILVSAIFNNIPGQYLTEEFFPVSERQVLFNFLLHWAQLPDKFAMLKSYARIALIPIIHVGTIFTNGFEFNIDFLDMMIQCQFEGFNVLNSLLTFHFDILIDIFIDQAFYKPKRESQMFFDVISSTMKDADFITADMLYNYVGPLILLTLLYENEKFEMAQNILIKLAEIFWKKDQDDISSLIDMIKCATNLEFVPAAFQFATEQLIHCSLDTIKNSEKVKFVTLEQIVRCLKPWFGKIRLLPKSKYIVQKVPSKFRVYSTILLFFDEMFFVSGSLSDEHFDMFADLWFEVLQSADNNVVVLLILSQLDDDTLKKRIFQVLLEKNPGLITKYLAERCSFCYWYFLETQPDERNRKSFGYWKLTGQASTTFDENEEEKDDENANWLPTLLTESFISYNDEISNESFVLSINYSILFIEKAHELFETLMLLLGIDDIFEERYFWAPDKSDGEIVVKKVVRKIGKKLSPQSIDIWTQEVTKWVVACHDIQIGYRSLVILNCLNGTLEPNFEIFLFESVSYHLSCFINGTADNIDDVSAFVGESFVTLYQRLKALDISNFAFLYASAFLKCPQLKFSCFKKAMHIFKKCVSITVLKDQVEEILIDAFYPFLPTLETNYDSQKTFDEILHLIDPTKTSILSEFYLIAAPFLISHLPFINIGISYQEIMNLKFTPKNVEKSFLFYQAMLSTASGPLCDCILEVSTKLLLIFNKELPKQSLIHIFTKAVERAAISQNAIDFLHSVSVIYPNISTNQFVHQQENFKSIEQVKNDICALIPSNDNIVPFTDCKDFQELHGLIKMENPPKIYPFSTDYEVYLGMKSAKEKFIESPQSSNVSKSYSTMSMTSSQILSNKSLAVILTPMLEPSGAFNGSFTKLEPAKIIFRQLDLPSDENSTWKFVVSLKEFRELGKSQL